MGTRADESLAPARRWWASDLAAAARSADPRYGVALGRTVLVWLPCFLLMGPRFASPVVAVGAASLLAAVWLVSLRSGFDAVHLTLGEPVRCAAGTALGLVGVSAVALWIPGMGMDLSTILALGAAVFALATGWELVARRVVGRRRVLVVGAGCAEAVATAVEVDGRAPFAVIGAVDDEPGGGARLGSVAELSRVIDEQRPDLVLLTDGEGSTKALDRLLAAPATGVKVVGLAHFYDHAFGRIPLEDLTPTWFMSILHVWQRPYTRFAKRTFDVASASLVLVLALPLMLAIAGVLRLTPGPILYRQTRVGEGGRPFTMHKFRTMRVDAEAGGRPAFAQVGDPRVTTFGRVLRRTHADELPQLFDVLRGDMSVVGPRPERPEFVPMLEEAVPFFTRRLLVKPGITGWAQLRHDYASDCEGAAQKLSYDLWYLRHRTLAVDLAICAKTFVSLLLRPGR